MNIEPGMLLMMNSLPKYAHVTGSLLEFLVLVIEKYDPSRQDQVRQGTQNAFKILRDKGVVR
jgi:integrator complex subunit 3